MASFSGLVAGRDAPTVLAARPDRNWVAADFHACETIEEEPGGFDWSFIDAAYCISLREREDRTASATKAFNEVGLTSRLLFYRPTRHPTDPARGIWASHCKVARHALAAGHSRVAIFEDDVRFDRRLSPERLTTIADAIDTLPSDWQLFYLGHWPLKCSIIRPGVLQTSSACTHAYIASRSLLEWLAMSDIDRHRSAHPSSSSIGKGIDHAFAQLPGAYATFPMIAIQGTSPGDHLRREKRGKIRRLRHIISRTRLWEPTLSYLMRPNERLAVSLAMARKLFETKKARSCRSSRTI